MVSRTAREALESPTQSSAARALARLGWLVPVTAVIVLWAFTIPYEFAFDDEHDILHEPAIHQLWPPTWATISRRPLVSLSFALNWAWTGSHPWSYRLVNIAIHACNAALLWWGIRTALRREDASARDTFRVSVVATVAATIWAIHPLQTSAVTYVVHRYESLAAGWMLACFAAWQKGIRARRPARWFALAVIAASAAMLSKEIAVVCPPLMVAYAWLSGQLKGGAEVRQRYRWLAALVAVPLAIAGLVYPLFPAAPSQGVGSGVSRMDYLLSQPAVFVHYLRLVFVPHPLSVDYYDWPVGPTWQMVPSVIVVAAIVGATIWACFRAPRLGWLGLVVFGVLAPTSSIIPLAHELVAERRMYLPLAPIVLLLVLGASRIRVLRPGVLLGIAFAAAVALGTVTISRNSDFRTAESLFRHDLLTRPRSARLHYNLAARLLYAGRKAEAWDQYKITEELDPQLAAQAYANMGGIAAESGWDDLAVKYLTLAVEHDPADQAGWVNATTYLLSIGRDASACATAKRGVAAIPTSADLAEKLAWVLATARDPAVVDGPRALLEATRAIQLDRQGAPPVSRGVTLAAAYAAAGRLQDAVGLGSMLLQQARTSGEESWVDILEPQVAAYGKGHRWIDSGRRHWSALQPTHQRSASSAR